MCLMTIDRETKKAKHGWKVFFKGRVTKSSPFEYTGAVRCGKYKLNGEWNTDDNTINIQCYDSVEYTSGYHIFFYRSDARHYIGNRNGYFDLNHKYIVKKVEVDKIVATGTENHSSRPIPVMVCRKFRVIKERRR